MKYHNPIIRGFNPDPSICRVGEEYYLVTSSFEYFPGIPVYHSRDLVNWEQIGNCLQDSECFPYEQTKDSGGVWAPTIRYEAGNFYVTATFDAFGNFVVHTKNPAVLIPRFILKIGELIIVQIRRYILGRRRLPYMRLMWKVAL